METVIDPHPESDYSHVRGYIFLMEIDDNLMMVIKNTEYMVVLLRKWCWACLKGGSYYNKQNPVLLTVVQPTNHGPFPASVHNLCSSLELTF